MNIKIATAVLLAAVLLIEIGLSDAHRRRCWGWWCRRRKRRRRKTTTTTSTSISTSTSTSTSTTSPTSTSTSTSTSTTSPTSTSTSTSTSTTTEPATVITPDVILICNFEVGETCFLRQDTNDDFDFTIRSGRTPVPFTGPPGAFNGDRYAYIQSLLAPAGVVARLTSLGSVILPANTNYCLQFGYNMRGLFGVGTLAVNAGPQGTTLPQVFSRSGNQGFSWQEASIDITGSLLNLQVEISATKGFGPFSDIAIDYIRLTPGTCANPITTTTTATSSSTSTTTTAAPIININ